MSPTQDEVAVEDSSVFSYGSSEISFSATHYELTYSDDVKPDTTTQINVGYAFYLTDSISLGLTLSDYSFDDEETSEVSNSTSILFSPRYVVDFNDGRFAFYTGPDIGLTIFDEKGVDEFDFGSGPEEFPYEYDGTETAIGGVIGLKTFLFDNVSLFGEYYRLEYDYTESSGGVEFNGQYENTGFRMGLSLFF